MADMILLDTNSSYKIVRQKPTAIAIIDITVIRPLRVQYPGVNCQSLSMSRMFVLFTAVRNLC